MEKASTRTRISFEVAVVRARRLPIGLAGRDLQLGRNEPLDDTARMFSRYLHGVVLRTFGHDRLETLAAASDVPVINALTDKFAPVPVARGLDDRARAARDAGFAGLRVAWIGDGNNMAHSWIDAARMLGFELRLACPERYTPAPDVLAAARARGANVTLTEDIAEAARGAARGHDRRLGEHGPGRRGRGAPQRVSPAYCVDDAAHGAAPRRRDLPALPARAPRRRGHADVIDGPASAVWDEAENRLHAQKALLELMSRA